eukprot:jgi/Tetstr1/466158/TSEL_010719.t1
MSAQLRVLPLAAASCEGLLARLCVLRAYQRQAGAVAGRCRRATRAWAAPVYIVRARGAGAGAYQYESPPIPDAAYDIPVDEAALTVDMRVPYQQLKQHVAAGPSGMRNEYLRCLVGEYAPASGPAAVRAMSEVASMYLQGRLPGWFNRLFASARLVAPVKKLGEGRAPDVRPVAVGEAERRAAERAVVDNMKEAYVSVLAPSQLGVGIPAGDSMLIHGVRLIAEKLGPRAVIVHTDLRNAYNEAWRRTIIQRHIDCSPLHPVIPALLASLSTDSYLVVDDRSAPLRSEDGVQQGAPLATTSFCVAIHPEVQQCDTTLEVNDGAARFNADDGFLVGLPEHVWPALHAFRTSIKASVGLEVRFDKMQAYSADMEAARREAPADIEWPELDGHHGIAVLNVPLGSPEYVQAYMRGKAEELREEVEAFAEAVDATILAAVERVLGVSFDPSTYGTDTNPVVTDFLAELLHDPDPMAAKVATLSEDAVARARSRLHLPTRLKGAGIRRMATVRDAAFIGCMNAILPRFLTRNSGTNTPTPGFFDPQLGSVLGRGSFNANSSARQYDHFLNDAHGSDSYAAEMREAWGRLQAATAGHLGDADARKMEREVEAASGSQKELTAFLDQASNSRLRNEVCALPATCRERILFNQLDAASGMWTVAIPTARTTMTPHELREVAAGYFFLPSPCLAPVVGCQIILPSTEHNPVIVDLYGDALMNLPAPGDAHWRVQHDAIADAFRNQCVHDLGIAVRREVDDLFQQAVPLGNTVPRDELKDLVPDAELSLPAVNVVTGSYDPRSLKSTLLEFKTMRLHDSGPARRGVAPAAAWTVANTLSVAGVAAGAAWAPRIDAAARSLQPARVRHHPADVVALTEVAAAWLAKARAVLAERHRRRGARRAGGAGQSSVLPSPALPSVAAFQGVAAPPVVAPTPPEVGAPAGHPGSQASRARYPPPPTRPSPAGDGVGWGAVDDLSDVDMVHMPAEMSMETAVPIDFQEAWAEAQRCVNERVVAAVEAGDPVVLDRALKWKYLLPQLLLRAPSRGGRRRRLQALAWRFRAFAERRMTELVRSWDDARTEAFYAGHTRQRRTDADLFAALLVGTADTVVALVELRDKHPSRSHPIPDAAYDILVDEAALTVDMRVPYQQLKQHVAAGPSGMRNEYLRCLVGEYAPASGPAAVRAMSEVASMYLQVGEAERRVAERAAVDNMNEAYVSVLAPSQLGVGIPAGDSMLIHGVRLIAEKLGPRADIVHTDLRNAYNEAWRRTIIQRHIDCSPLHHVIPALLASLSTDSYLVVDDQSAPLRSEDGVQQGAPLATTSFCVAIHPEVQQCDTTLEVNDGAARFNADDGFLVGLPEHVWPALHAFRTSIKASVGLEVRFDKMQAYSADMEAARREAPADIEWPELDGHHGIAVLNVPLESPEYVQAYMRGKAEELREEVDASLSKLLSAKHSRRYTHALHHHAWAMLKHCMQHKAGYWLRNCLPSKVDAFAEAVDATIPRRSNGC